jgi:hypothetical protein
VVTMAVETTIAAARRIMTMVRTWMMTYHSKLG